MIKRRRRGLPPLTVCTLGRADTEYDFRCLASVIGREHRMNGNLPDVSQWQPTASSGLRDALMTTCQIGQRRIVSRAEAEIRFNTHSFDSGTGVEDVIREELANLLPARYSVDAGYCKRSQWPDGWRLRRIDTGSSMVTGHQAWRNGIVEASSLSDRGNLRGC